MAFGRPTFKLNKDYPNVFSNLFDKSSIKFISYWKIWSQICRVAAFWFSGTNSIIYPWSHYTFDQALSVLNVLSKGFLMALISFFIWMHKESIHWQNGSAIFWLQSWYWQEFCVFFWRWFCRMDHLTWDVSLHWACTVHGRLLCLGPRL